MRRRQETTFMTTVYTSIPAIAIGAIVLTLVHPGFSQLGLWIATCALCLRFARGGAKWD